MSGLDLTLPQTPTELAATGPLVTQLPSAQASYARKYSDAGLNSYLAKLTPSLRNSLIQFDLQRVQRGQHPLSMQETLDTLKSYTEKHPVTPPEDQGFFQNALSDIASVASEIPHLPITLANEVTQLPDAPGKLGEAVGSGDIGKLADVPGVRLIPGVYTASTIANEGLGGLLKHPVFAALDVLPYAKAPVGGLIESGLSKFPRVAEARVAEAAALPELNVAREAAGLPQVEPASAARLALRTSPTVQALGQLPAANYFRGRLGQTAGDLAQAAHVEEADMAKYMRPDYPIDRVPDLVKPIRESQDAIVSWVKTIPEDRITELTQRLEQDRATVLADPALTDVERGFANDYITHVDRLGQLNADRNMGLAYVDGELFTTEQAKRIRGVRQTVGKEQAFTDARTLVSEPTVGTVPTIDTATILSEHLTRPDAVKLATGYAHALDAAGFDSAAVLDVVKTAAKDKTVPLDNIKLALDDTLRSPSPRATFDISGSLAPFARTDGSVAIVRDLVDRGDFKAAAKKWRESVGARTKHTIPDADAIWDELKRGRDRQRFLDRTAQFTPQRLAKTAAKAAKLEERIAPARFMPQIETRSRALLREKYLSDPEALRAIDDNLIGLRPDLGTEYAAIVKDVQKGWKDLREAGIDPVFVHRISDPLARNVTTPSLSDVYRTPSQVKVRTGDATPYNPNAAVALSHQGMELLSRMGTESFVDKVTNLYGTSQAEAAPAFEAQARAIHGNPRTTAAESVGSIAERLFKREYTEYDPASIFGHTQAKLRTVPGQQTWIPRSVDTALRQMFHEPGGYKLSAVFDPVMRVFRTAVLPLSLRWHVNNIGGGFILGTAEIGPKFVANLKRGYDFWKSGEGEHIAGMPPSGFLSQPEDIVNWGKRSSLKDRVAAAHDLKGGQFLRRLLDGVGPVKDAFGRVVDASYRFNGVIDDIYRSTAYLTGHDKALLKGMSAREAEQAGIGLVRKILPEWDRMTPMERTIMRSVFPFYSWSKFIIGYAYRFPMDHPFRTAVTASLARNELEDQGDALPKRFMDAIFLGHPDPKTGVQSTLNLSGVNPFRDVANYFTIAGFTGNLNPILQTALQAVGVDPSKGAQDLYPDIAYDPVTGRLRPSNPNLLSSFVSNVVPQTNVLTALIGQNNEFKQVLASNPEAAAALLRSAAGLPNIFRDVNPAQEAFKGELARESVTNTVKNEALKSGDYGRAMQFPTLRAYFGQLAQLRAANPQQFAAFTPTGQGVDTAYALQRGLVGLNTP